MKVFNAFQFNAVLVGSPFLINWLSEQESDWAEAAFYAACIAFAFQFAVATSYISDSFDRRRNNYENEKIVEKQLTNKTVCL